MRGGSSDWVAIFAIAAGAAGSLALTQSALSLFEGPHGGSVGTMEMMDRHMPPPPMDVRVWHVPLPEVGVRTFSIDGATGRIEIHPSDSKDGGIRIFQSDPAAGAIRIYPRGEEGLFWVRDPDLAGHFDAQRDKRKRRRHRHPPGR